MRRAPMPSCAAFASLAWCAVLAMPLHAATWTARYHPPTNEIVRVLSSPNDSTCWFITNFDRVYKTADGGQTWSRIVAPVFIPSGLFVVNNEVAFKAGTGTIYRTTNGGTSWSVVFSEAGSTIPEVWMLDANTGYLTYNGTLRRTSNGGTTWSTAGITQPPGTIINSSGKGTLWVAGDQLWVALANGGVARSDDHAATWTLPLNQGLTFTGTPGISFASSTFGMAIYHSWPFVHVTTDGGEHWVAADNSLGSNQDVLAFGSHLWYIPDAADHTWVRYSEDAGAHWVQQLADPAGFEVLTRSRAGRTLWTGTSTGTIYTYIEPVILGVEPPHATGISLRVQPNPAADHLDVSWAPGTSLAAGTLRYRILAVTGALVAQGELRGGRIDTHAMQPGCYMLEVSERGTPARHVVRWVKR